MAALNQIGISSANAAESIKNVSRLLNDTNNLQYSLTNVNNELSNLKNQLYTQETTLRVLEHDNNEIKNYVDWLHAEVNSIRSETVEKIETPKQKSDLEIFSSISWDKDFLNFCQDNIFLN